MDDGRFQLRKMDDAVDCYQQIMSILVDPSGKTAGAARFKHMVVEMLEQYSCSCGTTSEPTPSVQSILYFPATALSSAKAKYPRHSFGRLLREVFITESARGCQRDGCKSKVAPTMNVLNNPAVLAFGMSWTSGNPSVDTIKGVLRGLQPELRVDEAFACQASTPYKLLSLVCYYGKHYACFVHDDKTGSWTYFDDSIVREIGNTWADVLTKCESGRWQPQLLVYHRPGGSGHSYAPAAAGVGAAAAAAASGRGGGQGGAAVAAENVVKYPSASASAAVAPGSTVPHIGPAAPYAYASPTIIPQTHQNDLYAK